MLTCGPYIYIYDLVPKGVHARGYALQLKILLKTVFIWNVVLCMCMNEWIYSTDNLKIQSSHTEKSTKKWLPKMDINVPSDFCHPAYKQIANTWSNNHWFVHGKHHFIRITSALTTVVFSINWLWIFALELHQMCCNLKMKTLNWKTTASLWNHQKHCVCSDPCICTTQKYSVFFSKVLHKVWKIFPPIIWYCCNIWRPYKISNILYKTKEKAVSFLSTTSSTSRDLSWMTSFSRPHGVSVQKHQKVCCSILQWSDIGTAIRNLM